MTGLPNEVISSLVAEIGRCGRPDRRLGLSPGSVSARRVRGRSTSWYWWIVLLAMLVHPRRGITHDVLAAWFRVDRSTITRAVNEVRPLLAEHGCRVEDGRRLRTLAEVVNHLGRSGNDAILDATEVRYVDLRQVPLVATGLCRARAGRTPSRP
ncbi:transposase family protein [Umezawaea sp. Da 62-37]|uniref:helix-turn-helix domain-containing protein n=1 Tax=Umezawaea sp. Da 62-37 TaxID=3075927 RepID=UPI0028F714C9|nr:transposase family protein [Umezawaea sp. Da 62-37]WNV85073.1 transposase family protein [Umezawaea sp. Da 62-37]